MKYFFRIPIVFLALFSAPGLQAQIITTIAGTPTVFGFSGAGGPATSAILRETFSVAVDNAGNVYTCDFDNEVIYKINTAGIISIYAGNGTLGYTGDGGPATSAELYHPSWLTLDNGGNLYFLDQNNQCVRKISASGIISTIIPRSSMQYSSTGDGGPLSAATFYNLTGFIPDNAGNFYISDYGAGVIRKVNAAGIITTIAGTGVPGFSGDGGPATSAQLNMPYQVSFDRTGNIYIPDVGNNRIRKIDAAGIITTVAGNGTVGYSGDGGPATNAQFYGAWQVVFDGAGNMYIDDAANNCVRKVDNTGRISTYAGVGGLGGYGYGGDGGPATAARFREISGIALDNGGNLYIADEQNYIVRKVNNCVLAQIAGQPVDAGICAGASVGFTLAATGSTGYQWQVNGGAGWNNINDGAVYSGTTTDHLTIPSVLATMNGVQYRCEVANACGTISTVPATITVNTPSAPAVLIALAGGVVCAGAQASFTATPTNGGGSPAYQWQVNGGNVGTNSATYMSSILNSGDVVSCVLTSNSACATTSTATSNPLTMSISPLLTPAVSIAGPGGAVCAGAPVNFAASATNGGAAPVYQWLLNGASVGMNSANYMNSSLKSGDVVSCMLTTSAACATAPTAASNGVTMTVDPLVTPELSIGTASPIVCAGTTVPFTTGVGNSGANPVYQWLVNGQPVGTNSPIYSSQSLHNGDVVNCQMTSDAACLATPTVLAVAVTMIVNPILTPGVSVAGPSGAVCAGSPARFTASPVNGGASPSYQWMVNGGPVGTNSATYVSSSLNSGDAVQCMLTSDAACTIAPTAMSNGVTIAVNPVVIPSLSIAASTTTICAGADVTFTATPVDGGSAPGYQWQVNGRDAGPDKALFSSNGLVNGDVVSCVLTSSLGCSVPVASQNQVTVTVNPVPTLVLMPDTIIAIGKSVVLKATVTGPVDRFEWTPATGLDDAFAAAPVASPQTTTTYHVLVSTDANCTATGKVTIGVFKELVMPGAFTPNGDGKNDLFRIPPSLAVKIRSFAVYNRWGGKVFQTSNSGAGWDGTLGGVLQPAGTYVWEITYDDLLTGKPARTSGTVILVR